MPTALSAFAVFDAHFASYLTQAREARARNQSHDFRRHLFIGFLKQAFGIDAADVDVEQYIRLTGGQTLTGVARIRKGWIDAVFGALVFEFKRDVQQERADGLRELRDYLTHLPDGATSVGLLTDGLAFEVYVLDDTQPDGLRKTDSVNLDTAAAHVAYQWLDAYLLCQRERTPTADDIVQRFGVNSPTFVVAARILREALAAFGAVEAGALEVKRQQWAFHLARVYGSADVSNDEMFVRHTYLCQFAKLLAYTARFGTQQATERVEGIVDGSAFEVFGISNIGEQDFFAWVTAPEARAKTVALFRHLIASFAVYDLSRINEDLLKQLYQSLVGPETRHELGEFYTPDWLAELTLREINYQPGQSLLDPACGSGAFLFSALRRLAEQGLAGAALVDFALDNVMGMDVHPLAVTIAKINYLLALLPHLQQDTRRRLRAIPIALANSLQVPTKSYRITVIEVPFDPQRSFLIPVDAARQPNELSEVLVAMGQFAAHAASTQEERTFADFGRFALAKLSSTDDSQQAEEERLTWNTNVRWLTELIAKGRDSIWVYVLQNTSRPLMLRHRKFDVVAGNPPWIAYRFLQDPTYQREIKALVQQYGLVRTSDTKLFTQMELATLFYEHCQSVYLKAGGTIAFVMPRSVITGARQHRAFQQRGFSRVLDFQGVSPLFNTETCVLVRVGDELHLDDIPTQRFNGVLPRHECKLAEAELHLSHLAGRTNFVEIGEAASPYYPHFRQGATLVPRNLAFVRSAQPNLDSEQVANTTTMRTDPDLDGEAKAPWKGLRFEGHIDDGFLYATLLSKNLMPFGVRKLHLVALPVRINAQVRVAAMPPKSPGAQFVPMSTPEMRDAFSTRLSNAVSIVRTADTWFGPLELVWQQYRKSKSMSMWQRWNYQQGVVAQEARPGHFVVYNRSGSNISAVVVNSGELSPVNGARPAAFVADFTTYWSRADSVAEAHYVCALLNAPCVDAAIKAYQTRGIYVGPRDITRLPFEVCAIPLFDATNADHQSLAALSLQAHEQVKALPLREGGVVAARKQVRTAIQPLLREIDVIAARLLGIATTVTDLPLDDEQDDADTELDELVGD